MSVIDNSRSLFKYIDVLNYETSKSPCLIKNTILNVDKTERKKYETLDQPTNAINYYSFSSNTNELYYSDSEGSKLLILPQRNKFVHMSSVLSLPSSFDTHTNNCKMMNIKPLATSSPLNKLNYNTTVHKYYCEKSSKKVFIKPTFSNNDFKSKSSKVNTFLKNSDKTISSYISCLTDTPDLLNKNSLLEYKNLLISQEQKKPDHTTNNNIKQVSQKNLNDVTNILCTNPSQITIQKPSFTINLTDEKIKNNVFQLNLVSDETVNSNPNKSKHIDLVYSMENRKSLTENNIEENLPINENTTIISNNSQLTYNINKHTTFNKNYLDDRDLSDIFQMELSLIMFSGNIVPYLNSMKHEILQIMNKYMYKPDEQMIKSSKHVNDIIKNIRNIMKLNSYNCIDSLSNKKKYSTIPFVGVDLNNLNLLNNKLENIIKKKLEPVKVTLYDNLSNDQKEKSADQSYVQNDFLEFKSPSNSKSFKHATDNNNDVISSTKTAALDSFNCIRELNESNSLIFPINNSIDINESSKKQFLENCSLIGINELPKNDISETIGKDISFSSYNEVFIDKLAPIDKNLFSNFEEVNYNDNPVEKNQSRYWLRKNPKPTEQFIAPFYTSTPPKKSYIKSYYNDMFIFKGTGKKKVVLQYKIKSVLKANSDEFMKIICPEKKNKKCNNNSQNTTVFDISNLKPKKIEKPCHCGIFPSQVPSSWNDSLHKSLHKNLHKLLFKVQIPVNVASKINDNGFIFDIIKVTENCDDLSLRLTLKNIQEFINLEINFSKKSINNINHSIFLAVNPEFKIIGYLEIEPLTNACVYQNNQLSNNLIAVKFGISKLWVMVKYRNNGVATKLLKQFCDEENLKTNDIAFAFHGNHGISFIKKYFANNSVLIY